MPVLNNEALILEFSFHVLTSFFANQLHKKAFLLFGVEVLLQSLIRLLSALNLKNISIQSVEYQLV